MSECMESLTNSPDLTEKIQDIFISEGISRFGWTEFQTPKSMDFYLTWIKSKYHGDMEYLKKHIPYKKNPQKLLPSAVGAFCIAIDYVPHPQESKELPKGLRIARYARGKDYHHWFLDKLNKAAIKLKVKFPKHIFLPLTDSQPVLERELGYLAGLGWVGKNTCLISEQHGSLFFLGEIYTTLKGAKAQVLNPDRCGKCTKCIDACPTGAILSPKVLDARKCISYLTIESREIPSENLRKKMGDWYFGCDICQTVCPWNKKAFRRLIEEPQFEEKDVIFELKEILTLSNRKLQKKFQLTSLNRTSPNGHRRNAIIVATNKKLTPLIPEISQFREHLYLKELVKWALNNIRK